MRQVCKKLRLTLFLIAIITLPLSACSGKQAVTALVAPPQELLKDCQAPASDELVLEYLAKGQTRKAGAEYVRYTLDVLAAFNRCNEKMAGLRAFFGANRQ